MVIVVIRLRFHSQPKRFWFSNPSGSSLLVDILQQDTILMYDIAGHDKYSPKISVFACW